MSYQDVIALAQVQDEAVLLIHGASLQRNLLDLDVPLALDLEQPLDGLGGVSLDMPESGLDSAGQVLQTWKVQTWNVSVLACISKATSAGAIKASKSLKLFVFPKVSWPLKNLPKNLSSVLCLRHQFSELIAFGSGT